VAKYRLRSRHGFDLRIRGELCAGDCLVVERRAGVLELAEQAHLQLTETIHRHGHTACRGVDASISHPLSHQAIALAEPSCQVACSAHSNVQGSLRSPVFRIQGSYYGKRNPFADNPTQHGS
jgi:hypothetical protein